MTPVLQTVVDKGKGDCHSAVIASILDLDITQVPNFRLFDDSQWFNIYYYFMYAMGWQYEGCTTLGGHRALLEEDSINGYFDAYVNSRTFPDVYHAVVIDVNGIVVHDPNPNKLWQGIDVLETKELKGWYLWSKVEKVKR